MHFVPRLMDSEKSSRQGSKSPDFASLKGKMKLSLLLNGKQTKLPTLNCQFFSSSKKTRFMKNAGSSILNNGKAHSELCSIHNSYIQPRACRNGLLCIVLHFIATQSPRWRARR